MRYDMARWPSEHVSKFDPLTIVCQKFLYCAGRTMGRCGVDEAKVKAPRMLRC